jgi:DNA-binding NtrC family response regulator
MRPHHAARPASPAQAATPAPDAPILLVEDSEATAALLSAHLAAAGHRVRIAATVEAGLAALADRLPDLVLLDLNLPDRPGMDLLRAIAARDLGPAQKPAVVVITGQGGVPEAVEAMRLGAFDFLTKPVEPPRLLYAVAAALEWRRAQAAPDDAQAHGHDDSPVPGMLGECPAMRAVFRRLRRAAQSSAPVLVTGETGTGKELAAAALHQLSARAAKPFVPLNCAAIPRELLESELFGHARGAFTGALADRAGAAGEAAGGTLFLDEIGELDMAVQAKLLRFLQSGHFRRIGTAHEVAADVRFVCATHRDLRADVAQGRFREDLYYRLNVIPVALPRLAARGGDLVLLARSLLRSLAQQENARFDAFAPEAEAMLMTHSWPGNVRELGNLLRRIVVLEEGRLVTAAMLAPMLAEALPGASEIGLGCDRVPGFASSDRIAPLEDTKRAAILRAIRLTGGNVREAAEQLGIASSTIYRMGLAGVEARGEE